MMPINSLQQVIEEEVPANKHDICLFQQETNFNEEVNFAELMMYNINGSCVLYSLPFLASVFYKMNREKLVSVKDRDTCMHIFGSILS